MISSVRVGLADAHAGLSRYAGDVSSVATRLSESDAALAVLAEGVSTVRTSNSSSFSMKLRSGAVVQLDRASLAQLDALAIDVLEIAEGNQTASADSGYRLLQASGGDIGVGLIRRLVDASALAERAAPNQPLRRRHPIRRHR